MVTAKEVMTTKTPTLSFDTSVLDAVHFLSSNPTDFVAVTADAQRFQGVLTETVMMRIFLRYQSQPENEALILYRQYFEPMQLIHENEPFAEIVKKIVTAVGHRVFVINSESKVVGHITGKNILPYFSKEMGMTANSPNPANFSPVFKEEVDRLRSHLYLFENFFAKSPFMMHSVDAKGEIRMANEMLHAVLGYSYGELIGKTIFDLYPPENHDLAAQGIKKILSHGFNTVSKAQMVAKNKNIVEVELISRALYDQNKTAVGTITISRPLDMQLLISAISQFTNQ